MFTTLLNLSLLNGIIPIIVGIISSISLLIVLTRRRKLHWIPIYFAAAATGTGIGFGIAWYLGDVQDVFGVSLAFSTRAWFAAGCAGTAIILTSFWQAKIKHIIIGVTSIVLITLFTGIGINSTIGYYPTVGDALGTSNVNTLHITENVHKVKPVNPLGPLWKRWNPPANMPKIGTIGTVTIPSTISHFVARNAIVYLPPAALTKNAPQLPVMVFLSGQPGSPQSVINAGQMPKILNHFAATHHGLAPIVVIPDQLGAPSNNPMCLNSPLGQVQTYLTVDVPNWIKTHLNVSPNRTAWTIGGFSEGGTCSIQLGTKFKNLFGNIIDISGQTAPLNGSVAHTIQVGFAGNINAYNAETATGLLTAGAPYTTTTGIFTVGQNDTRYSKEATLVENAAQKAGMNIHKLISPGTGHDWYTEQYGVTQSLPLLAPLWGLTP